MVDDARAGRPSKVTVNKQINSKLQLQILVFLENKEERPPSRSLFLMQRRE